MNTISVGFTGATVPSAEAIIDTDRFVRTRFSDRP
jgi:hypothetical protein